MKLYNLTLFFQKYFYENLERKFFIHPEYYMLHMKYKKYKTENNDVFDKKLFLPLQKKIRDLITIV